MNQFSRGYALIHLDAIENNLNLIRSKIGPDTRVIGVIKADGYGHGAVMIAGMMERREEIWGYAVATWEEALELRRNDCHKPILILGYVFPDVYAQIIAEEIRMTVFTVEEAAALSEIAHRTGHKAYVHIKVDTGMSRIGIRPDTGSVDLVRSIAALPGIAVEGIFTHFACADESDQSRVREQFGRYRAFLKELEEAGIRIPMKHCANSAAIMLLPEAGMDLVRAGITVYGLQPSEEIADACVGLIPALEFKSHVAYVKTVPAGTAVSYGGTYVTGHETRIATIPIGYADGYARGLSNRGSVLIRGMRHPVIGRICMDQFMVDVSADPAVAIGDEVTLIGADGAERITLEEVGALSGRFHYEFACGISKRIPRIYQKDGKIVAVKDYSGLTGLDRM